MALAITSSAFAPNGPMPIKHTCEADDISPALQWSGVPDGAKSLVLIVDEPGFLTDVKLHRLDDVFL